jgi:Amidases related to nicotinamidase
MDALLIIDMQNGCFATPRLDREGTAKRINEISERFRSRGLPVIFVRHDGTKENYLFPGTKDFEVIDELVRAPTDRCVTKTVNDAFYRTDFDATLRNMGATRLFVCGLATDFCVNATIHSALVKDYDLVILSDCHTTADRPLLGAQAIIDFHNWLWAELTPTEGSIRVLPMKDALEIIRA